MIKLRKPLKAKKKKLIEVSERPAPEQNVNHEEIRKSVKPKRTRKTK